jgi:predicted porin
MTSSKKLIAALAVFLPLAAGAQATPAPAKPLFNIYGTLNVNLQFSEAFGSDANVHGRWGVSTDSSNIGIRGTADVAHGLGITYQCETTAQIDGVGIAGLCGRNSRIGVTSGFGTLFYGNWDTPFKSSWYGTKADDPFGNTDVADAAGIMGSPGDRTKSSAGQTNATPSANQGVGTTFAVRAANSVGYHSPKFGGLSFKGQYSTNEFANPDNTVAPELYSAGVNYDMGPLSVNAAWERHMDWLTTNSKDDGFKAGVGYELATGFGTTTLSVNADYLVFKDDAAAAGDVNEVSRWAGFVGLKHRMGDHEFRARYSMADEADCEVEGGGTCDAPDTGAQQYALGYAYHLSKAAQVYGFWTMIDNEANAEYVFATAGIAQITPGTSSAAPAGTLEVPGPGANPWAAGLGLRYAF